MIVHAHTHACTPAHTDTHIHTHSNPCTQANPHTCVLTHTSLTLTPMYTPSHIYILRNVLISVIQSHAGGAHSHVHSHVHKLMHSHIHYCPQPGSPLSGKPGTVTCPAHTQVETLRNHFPFIGSRQVAPKDFYRVPAPHMVETFENTPMF